MLSATFDIETSELEAVGAGWLLGAVIKPLGGEPKLYRYDAYHCQRGHEYDLVRAVINELCRYDLLIGHNIENFDWNYLKSRAARLGLPPPPARPFFYDTMKGFRRCGFKTIDNGYGKPTAKLEQIIDFFGLPQSKTHLYPADHWKTIWESGKDRTLAMDKLIDEHCLNDVIMTEQVYPLILRSDTNATIRRLR
jgi:DNA polymerase III epsilon subunit-like protein